MCLRFGRPSSVGFLEGPLCHVSLQNLSHHPCHHESLNSTAICHGMCHSTIFISYYSWAKSYRIHSFNPMVNTITIITIIYGPFMKCFGTSSWSSIIIYKFVSLPLFYIARYAIMWSLPTFDRIILHYGDHSWGVNLCNLFNIVIVSPDLLDCLFRFFIWFKLWCVAY